MKLISWVAFPATIRRDDKPADSQLYTVGFGERLSHNHGHRHRLAMRRNRGGPGPAVSDPCSRGGRMTCIEQGATIVTNG